MSSPQMSPVSPVVKGDTNTWEHGEDQLEQPVQGVDVEPPMVDHAKPRRSRLDHLVEQVATPEGMKPEATCSMPAGRERSLNEELAGLLPTFYFMEKRRLRRLLNGRVRRSSIWRHASETSTMVIVALFCAQRLQVAPQNKLSRWIPILVTLALFLQICIRTWRFPEHIFTTWARLECNLFLLWLAWEYDYKEHERQNCFITDLCILENEAAIIIIFCWIVFVTFLCYIDFYYVFPFVVQKAFWGRGTQSWWRIRFARNLVADTSARIEELSGLPGDGMHIHADEDTAEHKTRCYSYKPNGWLSFTRHEFGYFGERDENGTPHGKGMWFDNSFHGECLRGFWNCGVPSGSFTSREHGTGAQFAQRPVAYVTSRADCQPNALTKTFKFPQKLDVLRYGVAQVEVSLAGGFFPFLPQIQHHVVCEDVHAIKEKFTRIHQASHGGVDHGNNQYSCCRHNEKSDLLRSKLHVSVLREEELQNLIGRAEEDEADAEDGGRSKLQEVRVPIWYHENEQTAYVAESSLQGPARSLVQQPQEALVFLHGFNSDLATCLGRMAQLFALGGMEHNIVPFVFSYSAGFELSYLTVKKQFGDYGGDLSQFLTELGRHFKEVHILCHSCGAEFFFRNAEQIIECFAPARKPVGSTSSSSSLVKLGRNRSASSSSGKPRLVTLTMINPDVLVDVVSAKLPQIMHFAEHFTSYNDKKDEALYWSRFIQNIAPHSLKSGTLHAAEGRLPIVFGAVVSPLWLDQGALRGPLVELPGAQSICSKWRSLRTLMRDVKYRSSGIQIREDPCIDIIDCSSIEQNIHKLRHNYYMLNTQVVEDICELIGHRVRANHRTRLVRFEANVFNFLCPPARLLDM